MDDLTTLNDFENINQNVFKYVDPVALSLGLASNFLLCLVFLATPLKARPWSHVQIGIAVVDLMYVISCIAVHLFKRGHPVYEMPGMCQLTTFAVMVTRALQSWFVFIAHFDRLHSHFVHGGETRKRRVYNTKFALIIVTLLIVAPSVHILWSYEVRVMYGQTFCVPMRDDMQFHIIMRKIHMVGFVIVPLALTIGIDLFFCLKLSLHCFCSINDDDDEESVGDDLGVYTGYRINDSSFCTDNIVQAPLQDKRTDASEHLLNNVDVEKSRSNQISHHHHHHLQHNRNLSTIAENSSENVRISHSMSRPDHHHSFSGKTVWTSKNNHDRKSDENDSDDKYTIIKKKYSYDPNEEVARYILTTTQIKSQSEINENKLELLETEGEKEIIQDETKTTLVETGRYSKVDNPTRSHRTPNNTAPRQTTKKENVSMFSSNYKHSYTQNSVSYSQYHNYNYTSMASNVTRTTVVSEDHMFSDDVTPSSLTTVLIGMVFCIMIIPSAYVEGKTLFFSPVPFSRPSAVSIQKAIFFESLVLINSVYKFALYIIVLKSFRQAVVWFFSSCCTKRFSSSSSLCTISSEGDKKDNNNSVV